MITNINKKNSKIIIKSIIYDVCSLLLFISLFLISKNIGFPFYYFEPLRLIILLGFLVTNKKNAYILAIFIPLLSFIFISHPPFFKMIIVSFELIMNILILNYFLNQFKNIFISAFLSIVVSKLLYYIFEYIFININLLTYEQVAHPLLPQLIITILFSLMIYLKLKKSS